MEVGQFKTTAIIQARLGSTRLPNKVLLPLPANSNDSILSKLVNTLSGVKYIDEIYVATSLSSTNNILDQACINLDVNCFRGSEEDVLSRFYEIISNKSTDYVLRFTADNPIIDSHYLNLFIENHISKSLDYSRSDGLPMGCNFEMMKSSAIVEANNNTSNQYDKEHVTPYIIENAIKKDIFKFNLPPNISELRFTIDYPSDYAFMSLIYNMLNTNETHKLENFINLIEKNKWLKDINRQNYQKRKATSLDEEIDIILPISEKLELNRVIDFLKNEQKKYNL